MRRVFLLILIICCTTAVHSQKKLRFKEGPIISLKAGYHSSDSEPENYPTFYENSVPGGFSIDGTVEVPTGKDWYLGLNYDISFGDDNVYDGYSGNVRRTFTIYNFSPILKHRFLFERFTVNAGFGIGSSKMVTSYDKSTGDREDGMINLNIRLGMDYLAVPHTLLSLEAVYYGMTQIKFHGSGRSNNLFQIKAGISYIFSK